MNYKISFFLVLLIVFAACKNESKKEANATISTLEKAVEKAPNGENISKLLAEYNKVILNKDTHRKELKQTLDKAYKVTTEQNWEKEMIGFTTTYLKEFPADPGNEEKLIRLIDAMVNRNQKVTVNALKVSFLEAYPESAYRDSLRSTLDSSILSSQGYLDALADRIGDEESPSGLNVVNAREYVNATEAMALVLPSNLQTPNHLFFAAEVSRNIKTFDKTLYLYDWIIEKYPQYERAPTALFLKGFILENELRNLEKAREVYREFLEKYPAHDLADDVQFLYDNLGKSNEEILEMIEKNKGE
jgi:tetratricopeptide (TPR) repeat protein